MGIVPNRPAFPREVHQALWRNLLRSNQIPNFHFGLADEAELVWLDKAVQLWADAYSVENLYTVREW